MAINHKEQRIAVATTSTLSVTAANTLILYSTLVQPLLKAHIAAVVANPLFLIPSLALNYVLLQRNYIYTYGKRNMVTNMFLKQNGKQIIIETADGESKEVLIMDIYRP